MGKVEVDFIFLFSDDGGEGSFRERHIWWYGLSTLYGKGSAPVWYERGRLYSASLDGEGEASRECHGITSDPGAKFSGTGRQFPPQMSPV